MPVCRALLIALIVGLPACSPSCFLKPTEPFDADKLAAAPDYDDAASWAALPDRPGKAGFVPAGVSERDGEAQADVFFVHPTTWMDRKVWNDPLDSAKSREMLDERVLPGQASVFNDCCRIYAPLFRQATLGTFFADIEDAEKAFSVAYDDVERAFETFIDDHNDGRPFILAAHSQGSMHAMRLLEKIDADPNLRERMIAAYIPGFAHPRERFGRDYEHLPPCESPEQTGCINAWDTYREGASPDGADPLRYWVDGKLVEVPDDTPRQCTNPITWRADEEESDKSEHRGAVALINEGEDPSFFQIMRSSEPLGYNITGLKEPRTALFSARCQDGVLRVPDLDDLDYEVTETSSGNYHLVDYGLFYMDIRHNARLRTEAWLTAKN